MRSEYSSCEHMQGVPRNMTVTRLVLSKDKEWEVSIVSCEHIQGVPRRLVGLFIFFKFAAAAFICQSNTLEVKF